MKCLLLVFAIVFLSSCWKPYRSNYNDPPQQPQQKVWGSIPVYAAESAAKQIHDSSQKQALIQAGNIYAFGKYIFRLRSQYSPF